VAGLLTWPNANGTGEFIIVIETVAISVIAAVNAVANILLLITMQESFSLSTSLPPVPFLAFKPS
jgi:hypothetical protein